MIREARAVTEGTELPFWDFVDSAFRRQKMGKDFETQGYLTFLLERFLDKDLDSIFVSNPFLSLFEMISDPATPREGLRKAADAALFSAGVLMHYLRRSRGRLRARFYVSAGQYAYCHIARTTDRKSNSFWDVDRRFSSGLGPYVRILNEIFKECIVDVRLKDVVGMYERFLAGGCTEEDMKRLAERGVVFLPGPDRLVI